MDANATDPGSGAGMAGAASAAELEEALFNGVRGHLEEMIAWARASGFSGCGA